VRLAVLGGGAAGFFAAIAAAKSSPGARVEIFEASAAPLAKVRISGGGRCNVTHDCFDAAKLTAHYPRGQKELRGPFTRFGVRETVAWFTARGVALKTEEDGRMFPLTDKSETIVNCLLEAATGSGVILHRSVRIEDVERAPASAGRGTLRLLGRGAPDLAFDRVLVATGNGSRGYRIAQSLGHTIVPCVPSLFTFKVVDERLSDLQGISFDRVELSLHAGQRKPVVQRGPLLITHWGLSGPSILALSAWSARVLHASGYRARLTVNFRPGVSAESVRDALQGMRRSRGGGRVQAEPQFGLPRRYWARICRCSGIGEGTLWAQVTQAALHTLVKELAAAEFEIAGKGVFKDEFVTCGGVDLKEVDFRTMESKRCPGLYFAGEVLDIDGVTGGFNFQSAWTTGHIAGESMARQAT